MVVLPTIPNPEHCAESSDTQDVLQRTRDAIDCCIAALRASISPSQAWLPVALDSLEQALGAVAHLRYADLADRPAPKGWDRIDTSHDDEEELPGLLRPQAE